MSMFDWYEPQPPLKCPACGEYLETWQGKEGPCLMLRWKQLNAAPTASAFDEFNLKILDERLPERFVIYTDCYCGKWFEAECQSVKGVWASCSLKNLH